MRSYDDLCSALASCDIPIVRITWDPADEDMLPPLPHAMLVPTETQNIFARNRVVCRITLYDVEVYLRGSDIALESSIESALDAAGFGYDRDTHPLEDGVTMLVWHVTCIGI